jgi:hypothetical protein
MSIPESQLQTWSHQGAIQQSSSTYATVRGALEVSGTGYAGQSYSVFLQGSYGNDTNIFSESDVDVVIRLDSTFHHDLAKLPQQQKDAFKASHSDATYTYADFKRDVMNQLRAKFAGAAKQGAKAVKIEAQGNRRAADVLVATQFRRYHRFLSLTDQDYTEGICFFPESGGRIENYPILHSVNCTAKHQSTREWFKPMVRVLKNLRGKLVDLGNISKGSAPSYYLEGLLYNVPDAKFGVTYGATFANAFNWILQADRSKLLCANEQAYLVRDGTAVNWPTADCEAFLQAAVALWKNWKT